MLKEKAMAPHCSTLAWKIPWMKEPGRLQSIGSLRVQHDWATSLSLFTFMHWRRKSHPTPVLLPGKSQRQGSLMGCCLWGYTELDTTISSRERSEFMTLLSCLLSFPGRAHSLRKNMLNFWSKICFRLPLPFVEALSVCLVSSLFICLWLLPWFLS